MNKNKINRSIQFKNGSYSSILTLIVVFIVIIINLAVNALPKTLTTFQTSGVDYYSITDETKSYLKDLSTPINLYLLSDATGGYEEYTETICKIFEDNSKNITLKKIDVAINPTFPSKYDATNAPAFSVIVENANTGKYKLINYTDIYYKNTSYDTNFNPYYTYYYDAEGLIDSAINYVNNNALINVYEVTGHGETPLEKSCKSGTTLADALEKCNYTLSSEPLSLTSIEKIPEDCNALIINAPLADYADSEVEIIKNYMKNGGNTIVISNALGAMANNATLKNFYKILEFAGVSVENGYICEQDSNYFYKNTKTNPNYALIPDVNKDCTITQNLFNSFFIMDFSSRVTQIEGECESKFTPLFSTSSNYIVVSFSDDLKETYQTECNESAATGAILRSVYNNNGMEVPFNTLVIACDSFLTNFLNDPTLNDNSLKVITNAVKEMNGDVESIYVDAKTLDEKLNITNENQVNIYSIIYMALIPIIVILIGLGVWLNRRSK